MGKENHPQPAISIIERARKIGSYFFGPNRREWVPALKIENDYGDPVISVYEGPVDGAQDVIRIIHNQKAGRPLNEGVPEDSFFGKTPE